MPKRKFAELKSRDDRKLSMKAIRLTHKFEQGVQQISKALKIARGFERQKLSRREKTAKAEGNSATLSRLAEEVEALKAINYHVTAQRYLLKQLSKIKRVAESPAFKEFKEVQEAKISDYQSQLMTLEQQQKRRLMMARQEQAARSDGQPPAPGQGGPPPPSPGSFAASQGPKSTAEANVLARLFKSNPVKNVLPGILGDIRKLLGLEETPAGKQSKPQDKKDGTTKAKAARPQEAGSGAESEDNQHEKRPSKKQLGKQGSGAEEDVEVSGGEGSENEDFSQFDSRLAPGSDAEDDEDAEESDEDISGADNKALADDISDSVSRSPSPAFSTQASPPPKKPKGSKASTEPVQSTTFLPSLMMGGYWSGSEEASDDEGAAGPPKRKNRMGQQARRALWEKKYGAKANHVQQEKKQQKRNRDSGWDTRRGATDGAGGQGGKHAGRGGFGADGAGPRNRRDDREGQGQDGKPKGPPKDTGPLHPSWEAKRKLKEQTSTAAFQGKKVVFD